jgi:hypothetical protein
MSTATYTRRLIEHRYGHPLEKLQRGNTTDDPVLPTLLRRLDGLAQTDTDARAASRNHYEPLRQGLRDRGIHLSNRRLGAVLQRLRTESSSR